MNKKRLGIFLGSIALLIVCSFAAYQYWLAPTRILIINATLAQAADIALNNDCARIEVTCIKKEEVKDLSGYDAIVMYSRGLYLDDGQIAEVERVGASGVPVFTNTLRNFTLSLNHNVTNEQQHTLREYLKNGNKHNYRNALLYLRHIATPHRCPRRFPHHVLDTSRLQCLSFHSRRSTACRYDTYPPSRCSSLPAYGTAGQ